jgi:hypothetical protein
VHHFIGSRVKKQFSAFSKREFDSRILRARCAHKIQLFGDFSHREKSPKNRYQTHAPKKFQGVTDPLKLP